MMLLTSLLTLVLLAIAAAHAYWGLGGLWPGKSEAELAHAVIGTGQARMPPPWACFAVAILLLVVSAWPWLLYLRPSHELVLTVGVAIAAVFFVRGLAAYSPRWRSYFPAEPFATRDRRLYGPLCMVLATGFASLMGGKV